MANEPSISVFHNGVQYTICYALKERTYYSDRDDVPDGTLLISNVSFGECPGSKNSGDDHDIDCEEYSEWNFGEDNEDFYLVKGQETQACDFLITKIMECKEDGDEGVVQCSDCGAMINLRGMYESPSFKPVRELEATGKAKFVDVQATYRIG